MTMQKIYKSALASVHVRATIPISLCALLGLTPQAVAETSERVITLSQLQTFRTPVLSPAVIPYSRTGAAKLPSKTGAPKPKTKAGRKNRSAAVDHYKVGLALKAKGNSNRALIEFLKATHKNPRQINAFYEQALIFRQQGYLKLADSSLEQALRIAKTPTSSKSIKRRGNFKFALADVNKIRFLLATIRLEQGNVRSAAQQLGESLGIEVSQPVSSVEPLESTAKEVAKEVAKEGVIAPKPERENGDVAVTSTKEIGIPTTILQSLHLKVEETPVKTRSLKDEYSAEESSTFKVPVKESFLDTSVADFIRDGLAGIKEHVMNPLSFLPKISFEQEKTTAKRSSKTKERRRKTNQKPQKHKDEAVILETASKLPDDSKVEKQSIETKELVALAAEPAAKAPAEATIAAEVIPEKKGDAVEVEVADAKLEQEKSDPLDSFSLIPPAITARISMLGSLLAVYGKPKPEETKEKETKKPLDPITARLKYLSEHGTASLKDGEAFMFSEESGEATLFKPDGEVIRRIVASAKGHEEIAKLRRPDILIPEELLYNLALMAKLLPKQETPPATQITGDEKESAPKLNAPTLLSRPHTFSDWLRDVLSI